MSLIVFSFPSNCHGNNYIDLVWCASVNNEVMERANFNLEDYSLSLIVVRGSFAIVVFNKLGKLVGCVDGCRAYEQSNLQPLNGDKTWHIGYNSTDTNASDAKIAFRCYYSNKPMCKLPIFFIIRDSHHACCISTSVSHSLCWNVQCVWK